MKTQAKVPASVKRMLLAQAVVTLLVSAAAALYGQDEALSAMVGGLICLIANCYAAWRVFTAPELDSAPQALSGLYRAEVGKLIMMAALFIAVFAGWKTVNTAAFLGGFGAAMVVGILGAAVQRTDRQIPGTGATGTNTDG